MPWLLLILFLAVLACRLWLRWLNLGHLRRHGLEIPAGFEAVIDRERLQRSVSYTLAQSRLGLVESLAGQLLFVVLLFGGPLAVYDRWIAATGWPFVVRGLAFFALLGLGEALLSLPFGYYRQFVLEARFGFNTMTLRLWAADLFKSLLLAALITGGLLAAALVLIQAAPTTWWLWVWLLLALVSLLLIYLSPVLIEPLFFKYVPLQRPGLAEAVRALMTRAGLPVSQVQQVDASRRSRHSNAYFTGIGRVKRIVLFDTLLEQMADAEILAVLAHEAGHWRLGHVRKRLCWSQLQLFGGCLATFLLLRHAVLPPLFGQEQASLFLQLLQLGFLAALLLFPLKPLASWLSRRHEWQADRFAADLQPPADLATALVKLSRENLANLHPHPWYAWFHFSHPPVTERVARLRQGSA